MAATINDKISSINDMLNIVIRDTRGWKVAWFRGQPVDKSLRPSVLRDNYIERDLTQSFRLNAPAFGETPNRNDLDEWLFLMQHYGLPTRLLDWTENALVALFFALNTDDEIDDPVFWILNPIQLNAASIEEKKLLIPWSEKVKQNLNIAFGIKHQGLLNPIAIRPGYSKYNSKLKAQKSCFTIHGVLNQGIEEIFKDTLVDNGYLYKYHIKIRSRNRILKELKTSGVSFKSIFHDFYGLAKDLKEEYIKK